MILKRKGNRHINLLAWLKVSMTTWVMVKVGWIRRG